MNRGNYSKLYRILIIIALALTFVISSMTLIITRSKYVTEMGWDNSDNVFDYEVDKPFDVGSQMDLFNAISNGYSYIRIADNLGGPIIMTGNSLDLQGDLTIDLNGNEIQRNSREGLISVTQGTTLTIIDTARSGGGGLYNPTGNVLALDGGTLNVFGGKFESGPRPEEYYTNLNATLSFVNAEILAIDGNTESITAQMPAMPIRDVNGKKTGNVYLDKAITGGEYTIPADTYCYTVINGVTSDDVASFDMSKADYVYKYKDNNDEVIVFCYQNVIKSSVTIDSSQDYPNYAAVQMNSGTLHVNVVSSAAVTSDTVSDGSFYSYFGTPHTSCIYMTGGDMDVNTTGSFSTVNPADLPASLAAGTADNPTAKMSEGSCIICNVQKEKETGGVLNITQLKSATAYNGSIIDMRGGTLNISNAGSFTKNATMSHTDIPRSLDTDTINLSALDAAIFVQGGKVNISNSNFTVNKTITSGAKTTYGILSRGVSNTTTTNSVLICDEVSFTLNGERSYGIYATRGEIQLNNASDITVNCDNQCYGVYVANMGTVGGGDAANITLKNSNVKILKSDGTTGTYVGTLPSDGLLTTASGAKGRVASVAVYLNSEDTYNNGAVPDGTREGGKITLINSEITSQEIGVAVNHGDLLLKEGGEITTYNASAVALNSGNVTFEEGAAYTINAQVNRQSDGATKDSDGVDTRCWVANDVAIKAGTHQYELYLPWHVIKPGAHGAALDKYITGENLKDGEKAESPYENNNGIRVLGGNFNCYGFLDMQFRGLYNDFVGVYDLTEADPVAFDNIVIKSFAVVADTGGNIDIRHGNIVNTVGGGVKVQGGTISLGTPNATGDGPAAGVEQDITIETHGIVHADPTVSDNLKIVAYGKESDSSYGEWHFYPNLSGGHAVISRDGDINIYGGTYSAYYGNGVAATTDTKTATIKIYNGEFNGDMYHRAGNNGISGTTTIVSPHTKNTNSGPASHYGIKVMGGAEVHIYGGTFKGKNGGAMVRGQLKDGVKKIAKVFVYEGNFSATLDGTTRVGNDGFCAYDMCEVYLGAYIEDELAGKTPNELININAKFFPVALNPVLNDYDGKHPQYNDHDANVYIYYGTMEVDEDQRVSTRAIAHFDTNLYNSTLFIYNVGSNVKYSTGLNSSCIRCLDNTKAGLQNSKYGYELSTKFDTKYFFENSENSKNTLESGAPYNFQWTT